MEPIEPIDAGAQGQGGKSSKTRNRKGAKPAEAVKRSLNLRIDDESYERLHVHALRRRTTVSALVESLSRDHLREFSIHRNAGAAKAEGQG